MGKSNKEKDLGAKEGGIEEIEVGAGAGVVISYSPGKAKMEQHKTGLLMDLNSCKHTLEELNMEKAHADKNNKMMQNEVLESANRLEDLYQNLNEGDIVKKRLGVEREDLEKQITEGENQMRNLAKMKSSLANQLEDMKRLAEGEARDKAILVGKFKVLLLNLPVSFL